MNKFHNDWNFMKYYSIYNYQAFFIIINIFGYIRLVYVFQLLKKYFLVMINCRIEVNFNFKIVIRLFFCQNRLLAMKNNNGLKKDITVNHDIKNNNGLPFISAIAVKFTGYNSYFFSIIGIIIKEFEGQKGLVKVDN